MTRFLVTSDWQTGAGADYGRYPGDRLNDQQATFQNIADLAVDRNVDAVLHAGDVFERRRPTPGELLAVKRPLATLETHGIPTVVLAGNHDVETFDGPCALDVLANGFVRVSRRPEVVDLGGVAVGTLPWSPLGHLLSAREGDRDRAHADAADLLLSVARDLRDRADGPAVLLAHWALAGASLPTGLPVEQLREPVLDTDALADLGFDAVAAGHIHSAAHVGQPGDPPIFHVGAPMVTNFAEADTAHGVWIVDTDDVSAMFVPLEDRPFVTLDYDYSRLDPPALTGVETVRDAANDLDLTGAVVRVRMRATVEQAARIDQHGIRSVLLDAGAHKVYAVTVETVRAGRARVQGLDENATEREAVSMWAAEQDLPSGRAEQLDALTGRYLKAVKT